MYKLYIYLQFVALVPRGYRRLAAVLPCHGAHARPGASQTGTEHRSFQGAEDAQKVSINSFDDVTFNRKLVVVHFSKITKSQTLLINHYPVSSAGIYGSCPRYCITFVHYVHCSCSNVRCYVERSTGTQQPGHDTVLHQRVAN